MYIYFRVALLYIAFGFLVCVWFHIAWTIFLSMMAPIVLAFLPLLSFLMVPAYGASSSSSCSGALTPTNSIKPSVASGYQMALVATGLTKPRSLQFDSAGNLLVVEAGSGIVNLAFQDNGGSCVSVKTSKTVVKSQGVRIICLLPDNANDALL